MRPRMSRLVVLLVGVAVIGAIPTGGTAQEGPLPATEQLFIAAGCPPDNPATCTSTRWLGRSPGDATSNYLTATTPVDEVFYQAQGSINWRDYPSDETLREGGYELRSEEPIRATVTLSANVIAANTTVHARIDAFTGLGFRQFGPLEQVVTILPSGSEEVEFEFAIPAELEGVAMTGLTFYVAVHGVNVQGGYIDQEGGSDVLIPYWVEPEVA